MHLNELFITLAVILVTAGFTTILFKWLRQPLVLGYILTGFLVGSQLLVKRTILDIDSITLWGEIGVIFLLFALGLEFNFKKLRKVGRSGAITGVIEALFMTPIGYLLGQLMGWSTIESIFLGGMLSISSTSIVIKAFEDLNLKSKRFTQVVFGVLIAEDIIAVLLMVMLTSVGATSDIRGSDLVFELAKLMLFIFLWFSGGIFIFPTLLRKLKHFLTDEILLIVTLGLCFAMVVVASKSGFSAALGAFLMGVIIAETDEQERILRIITPIRQLFASIFFISVGMLVEPKQIAAYWDTILIISGAVLIIKPTVATIGLLISRQPLKTAIQSGYSLAQIGEFSFIIASVGLSLGVLQDNVYPIIVSVSVISTFMTPYFMRFAPSLHNGIIRGMPRSWRYILRRDGTVNTLNDNIKGGTSSILGRYIVTMLINLIWLTAILLFTLNIINPFVETNIGTHWGIKINVAIISLIVMAPFMYALTGKHYDTLENNAWKSTIKLPYGTRLVLFIMRYFISSIFVYVVVFNLINNTQMAIGVTLAYMIIFVMFTRIIRNIYHRMESRFLSNLDKSKIHKMVTIPLHLNKELHTEIYHIPSNSIISGCSIKDIHRKFRTGAQILAIHRRGGDIELPSNEESLYSGDKILVIGNDEQILHLKCLVDTIEEVPYTSQLFDMELFQIMLNDNSTLIGECANVSKLREGYEFILVGYHTDKFGFTRPNPKYIFKSGDILWIVGNRQEAIDKINLPEDSNS